jgi:hypothetical protein
MMDALTIVFGAVDLPLVIGVVALVQIAKGLVKLPARKAWMWMLLVVIAGFGAAWLKVDVTKAGAKALIIQGIVYSAAASFVYQGWRVILDAIKAKK